MRDNEMPCCAADGMRRATPADVNGATVGLSMLDLVFAGVRALDLADDATVRAELVRRVKVYNYVPPEATGAYALAVHREDAEWNNGGTR